MCKAVYIVPNGTPKRFQPDVNLNTKEGDTFVAIFLYDDEHEMAVYLNESYDTTRTRIQRLYDKCDIPYPPDKEKRCIEQLKEWSLNVRLIVILNGEPHLSTYHIAGEGRQLELQFTY